MGSSWREQEKLEPGFGLGSGLAMSGPHHPHHSL
jgi:hypothetical protein